MSNKRRQKRFVKRCEVEFISDNLMVRGISSDFSLEGLFIRTNHPYTPGTVFDIVVHLPDGADAKVKGRAVHAAKTPTGKVMGTPVKSLKNGMGIEIIEKDDNYISFIKSLTG
jgi:hypothetical protein